MASLYPSVHTPETLLTSAVIRDVHRRMFAPVWRWAGTYRIRELSIGDCPPEQVAQRMEQLLGNSAYQLEAGRPAIDVAVDLHHGLTLVHAFVNGNGRHARLVTELFAEVAGLGEELITWGSALESDEERRSAYLAALREADKGKPDGLRAFMTG